MANIDFASTEDSDFPLVNFFDEKGIVVDGTLIKASLHYASDARIALALLQLQKRIEKLENKNG